MTNARSKALKFVLSFCILLSCSFGQTGDFDEAAEAQALSGAAQLDAAVYFLTGGIWDWMNPPAVHRAFQRAIQQVRERNPDLRLLLAKFHQRQQGKICAAIAQTRESNPNSKVILFGHSYGGVEALGLARCLQKRNITVDLVITVDSVAKWIFRRNRARMVPENVRANFHYFTRGDLSFFFTSVGHNRPVSPQATLVKNFKVATTPIPFFAHMSAATRLLTSGVPQSLIQGVLEGRSPAELEDDHRGLHETLFTPTEEAFLEPDLAVGDAEKSGT